MIEQQITPGENPINIKQKIDIKSINFDFSNKKYIITKNLLGALPVNQEFYEKEFMDKYKEVNQTISTEKYTPDTCPLCSKKLNRNDLFSMEEYDVYNCIDCGSILFDPPIDRNTVDNFFSELDPDIVHAARYKNKIEKYTKLFTKLFPKRTGKTFLSIESSQGYAVEAVKNLGFATVKGIDRYDFYTEFQKNNFGEKFFETISLEDYVTENREPADIVVSIESMCREPNIDEYIKNLSQITKLGGTLYIEEVDGNSYFLPSDLSRWVYIQPPLTCNFISKEALYGLLRKHGFKVKKKLWNWGYMMKIVAIKVRK